MQIYGLNKTTLLDYPEHVAATIFTGGCNFRCPFCHNGDLVLHSANLPLYEESEILAFLKKRRGVLTGVCITGGEPTLQTELPDFLSRIQELGYLIKLDTNGYRPDVLKKLAEKKLLNYVAMDIKNAPGRYGKTAGLSDCRMELLQESTDFLMSGCLPYEFRTTVVKELHDADCFREIASWLKGCRAYYLQSYKESDGVIAKGFHSCEKEELLSFLEILLPQIPHAYLRGVD